MIYVLKEHLIDLLLLAFKNSEQDAAFCYLESLCNLMHCFNNQFLTYYMLFTFGLYLEFCCIVLICLHL